MTIVGTLLDRGGKEDSDKSLSGFLTALLDKKQEFDSRLLNGEDFQGLLTRENPKIRFLSFRLLAQMSRRGVLAAKDLTDVPCFSGVPLDVLKNLLTIEPVIARFPVVFGNSVSTVKNRVEIARALVFYWDFSESRCVPFCPKPVPPERVLDGRRALVVFDRDFQGASFQLAVSVAIRWGRFPDGFVFTGAVADDGTVLAVDYEDEKRGYCRKEGMVMIGPSDVEVLDEVEALCFNDVIDVPFFVHVGAQEMGNSLNKLVNAIKLPFSFSGLCRLPGLDESSFYYEFRDLLPDSRDEWYGCLKAVRDKIAILQESVTPRRLRLHLALRAPSDFALMLGAVLRGRKLAALTVYQYAKGVYSPAVGALGPGEKFVKLFFSRNRISTGSEDGPIIGLRIGQDSILPELDFFSSRENRSAFILDVGENSGKIPDGNWNGIVNSLGGILMETGGDSFSLVLNVPVALATGLGMYLGHNKNIQVLHMGGNGYFEVGNLRDLRRFSL